jgi:hypothetical protein
VNIFERIIQLSPFIHVIYNSQTRQITAKQIIIVTVIEVEVEVESGKSGELNQGRVPLVGFCEHFNDSSRSI